MKKFMAAAAGALLIAGQVTSAMAATSDAAVSTTPNARVLAATYCGAPTRQQLKMNAHSRAHVDNRCAMHAPTWVWIAGVGFVALGAYELTKSTSP